jgi:hypothetical protein
MQLPAFTDLSFWWGMSLAIPLAIVANLLTPFFFKLLSYFSTNVKSRRQAIETEERRKAAEYTRDKAAYSSFQFSQVTQFAVIAALSGLFAGAFASFAHVIFAMNLPDRFGQIFFIGSQTVVVIASLLTLTVAKRGARIARYVREAGGEA